MHRILPFLLALLVPAQWLYAHTAPVTPSPTDAHITGHVVEQGGDVVIAPCRWCIGAGSGKKDRMMVYVNDEDKVNFDLTVPLTRAFTQPSAERAAYITLFAAQIGQVKFNYYQPVGYYDGI